MIHVLCPECGLEYSNLVLHAKTHDAAVDFLGQVEVKSAERGTPPADETAP